MRRIVTGLALLVALQASAGIYKTYDKNGNPVFSDDPSGDAETVETREPMVVPSLPVELIRQKTRGDDKKGPQEEKEPTSYTLEVEHPAADEVISHGSESYGIVIKLEPRLWNTHHLEVWVDGARIARDSYNPKLSPLTMDRGQHRLEVKVVNAKGAVLTSVGRDFHVQHPSVIKRTPAKSK